MGSEMDWWQLVSKYNSSFVASVRGAYYSRCRYHLLFGASLSPPVADGLALRAADLVDDLLEDVEGQHGAAVELLADLVEGDLQRGVHCSRGNILRWCVIVQAIRQGADSNK